MTSSFSRTMLTAAVAASALMIPARVDAQRAAVPRPASTGADEAPQDATGRCRDGSFTTESDVVAACAARTGVLVTFPRRQTPPRPAAPVEESAVTQAIVPAALARPVAPPPAPVSDREGSVPVAALPVTPPPATGTTRDMSTAAPPAAATRPRDARGQCKDGTYFLGAPESACTANGGMAVAFPAPSAPPPAAKPASPGAGADRP
jgi:hypothetical protein